VNCVLWAVTVFGVKLSLERDRAEQKWREAEDVNRHLACLARHDHLTKLPNRRYLDDQLTREHARAKRERIPLSLVLIDIDWFKAFNDLEGHSAGDACLVRLADAMVLNLRRGADFLARYGGEEFALVLPGTPLRGAIARAEAMRHSVERLALYHPDAGSDHRVTISLGVATMVPSRLDHGVKALIDAADTSLYQAKREGRNRVGKALSIVELHSSLDGRHPIAVGDSDRQFEENEGRAAMQAT
jgi:diguanylate cyclase (GGDEF)-like protein